VSAERGYWRVVDVASGAVLLEQHVDVAGAALAAVAGFDTAGAHARAGYEAALEWMDPDGTVGPAGQWNRAVTVRTDDEGNLEWTDHDDSG